MFVVCNQTVFLHLHSHAVFIDMGSALSSPLYDKYMALPLNDIRVILLDFLTPAERRTLTTVSSTLHAYIGCSEQASSAFVTVEA